MPPTTTRLCSGSNRTGFFSPADVGVKMYSYPPANQFSLTVTNNFELMSGTATQRKTFNKLAGVSDDVTVVRGRHQLGFGGRRAALEIGFAWNLPHRRHVDR